LTARLFATDTNLEATRSRGSLASAIPAVLAVAVLLIWAVLEGGFPETRWLPGALFLLGLLIVTVYAYRERPVVLPRPAKVAVTLLGAFTCWSFLSIIWAEVPATAWNGANHALLYLIVYALFLLPGWRPTLALQILGLYAAGLAVVGAVLLVTSAGSPDATLSLVAGRFAEPTGYPNAVAALFAGGFWPALLLASRPETPWPLRGVMLAAAGLLIQLALLPQSRGALIVFPIAVFLYVAIAPQRLRAVQMLLAVGLATLLTSGPILDVFATTENGGDVGAALTDAQNAMALSFLALLAVGMLVGLVDARIRVPPRVTRFAGVTAAGVAALAAFVLLVAIGNPVSWTGDRWEDFKRGYESTNFESSRLTGDLGSNRYDFWRVAVAHEFADAPLLGNGAENFAVGYLRERESDEEPFYPHSLPLLVLAGTGVIGGLLFGGFLVAALVGAARTRWRSSPPLAAGIAASSIGAFAYWALHSLGDWLWSFPAITAPVFAWLALSSTLPAAESSGDLGDDPRPRDANRSLRRLGFGIGGLALVFAVLSLLLPWAAARDVELAASDWEVNPGAAYARLDRARSLNFLSAAPDVLAGTIASERNEAARAEAAFSRALEREPTNWYARLQLGTLAALDGRTAAALDQLGEALRLNPGDPLLRAAYRRARAGNPLSTEAVKRRLLERVCGRIGRTDATEYCD
jgi:hypothetical protein